MERLQPAAEDLFNAFARLPSHFVSRHSWQVGAATYFVSYFTGMVAAGLQADRVAADPIRAVGADVSEFDAYFAAHASFRDSQEKWIKRAFSRRLQKEDFRLQAESVLARHDLRVPAER